MRVFSMVWLGVLLLGAGCGGDSDDTGDEGGGPADTCEDDPAYGDGTCDLDLTCEAPDIDCYILFADEPEARSWFAAIEEQVPLPYPRSPADGIMY